MIKCITENEDEINLTSAEYSKFEKFDCGFTCILMPFSQSCKDCSKKCGMTIDDEEQEPSKDN